MGTYFDKWIFIPFYPLVLFHMFIDSGISQGADWNISWGNCAQNPRYCNIAHNHQPKLNLCTLVMDFRNKSYIFIVIKFIW